MRSATSTTGTMTDMTTEIVVVNNNNLVADNQIGKDGPQGERLWNPKNFSWGAVFVADESKHLI